MSDAFEQWAADKSFMLRVSAGDGYVNVKEMARQAWQAALQSGEPVVPEGYVLLPVEPTEAMMDAFMGRAVKYGWELEVDSPRDGYKAMLSAGKEQQ